MHTKYPFLSLIALLLMLTAATSCRQPEILVKHIIFDPDDIELLVGGFKRVSVSTYPHYADNEGDLEFIVGNKKVAAYDGTSVVGLSEGKTEILATCGDVSSTCKVRVFEWYLTLENVDYGISTTDAQLNDKGPGSPKELEIKLSHDTRSPRHQFTVWIPVDLIGQKIDLTQQIAGVFVSGTYDGTQDGYVVATMSTEATKVYHADWSAAEDVTVTRGSVLVDRKSGLGNQFSVKADVHLSNGFQFGAEWEGKLPVTF